MYKEINSMADVYLTGWLIADLLPPIKQYIKPAS